MCAVHQVFSIRNTKSRRIRWARYVARMEKLETRTGLRLKISKGRGHLEETDVDGKKIVILMLKECRVGLMLRTP
jgi:hypothetical protein